MNYPFDSLSNRQKEVLSLIAQGNTNKKIGEILELSEATIKTHRKHIKKKLNAKHTADLCRIAQINNLL